MFKRFKKFDFLIIISVLILSLGVFFIFSSDGGKIVEISVSGELYGTYSLFEDSTIDIKTNNGNLTVVIENSEVFVLESDCRDGECEKQTPVTGKGQSIICLPLETVISIGEENYELAF